MLEMLLPGGKGVSRQTSARLLACARSTQAALQAMRPERWRATDEHRPLTAALPASWRCKGANSHNRLRTMHRPVGVAGTIPALWKRKHLWCHAPPSPVRLCPYLDRAQLAALSSCGIYLPQVPTHSRDHPGGKCTNAGQRAERLRACRSQPGRTLAVPSAWETAHRTTERKTKSTAQTDHPPVPVLLPLAPPQDQAQ